jgi:adenosine kinase
MRALISGSYAYDNIMVFQDKFKNHILPDKVHILNVSFLVPTMRREFGGCAGNIAYNLKLLGGTPVPMATVGDDFAAYATWMDEMGISREAMTVIPDTFTGQAFITTDMDDNQITAFHPGAMDFSHQNSALAVNDVALAIVSPAGKQGMMQHCDELSAAGIPFIFDPGQGLPMFSGEELKIMIGKAKIVVVNDYEAAMIYEKTGLDRAGVAALVEAFIVTRGAEGSTIIAGGRDIDVPALAVEEAVDPTGCGDAYRGGLLYGLLNNLGWKTTGQIAALMGAIKVTHAGTQNHHFTLEEFASRYQEEFGEPLSV